MSAKIHELLDRDPRRSALANTGQARIVDKPDDRSTQELRAELETFVCDGQYGEAIDRILRGFLTHVDKSSQVAAWVSGFYGSGKSHLLKMLAHLWVDTEFADGTTARSLVRALPVDVQASLRELDTLARRGKVRLVAAAGTLPSGRADDVRLTVLSIVLRSQGLPESYPQAQFTFWLREQGFLDKVRAAVESAKKDWLRELTNLYVSPVIARAVLACDPNFASDEREARKVLREQFPDRQSDISTAEFLAALRQALVDDGDLPYTILVLDEVQQYIGSDDTRATTVVDLAEAIAKQCDSRILLVASGQAALTATPQLHKLRDRFRITAQLSDADVEVVTRKVLLQKKPSALAAVTAVLDKNAGEVSKHLLDTRLAERREDSKTRDLDYPLLPTRRRFWEEAFRAVDKAGNHSQLRSQLRILHDALQRVAESPVGSVITADVLFDAIAADLVNSGVLPNEINNKIRGLDDGTDRGKLRQRLCGLVFLINKLPREAALDTGVRASARILADLLIPNVDVDSGPLRQRIATELADLAALGTLMQVDDEYFLQTTEGAEWERAYRERVGALLQRDADLYRLREQVIGSAVQDVLGGIRLLHGQARQKRSLVLHADADDEPRPSDQVTVWLRDQKTNREVEDAARRRSAKDPVVHVQLPKRGEDLRTRIAEFEAARQIIAEKGVPSSPEGQQARDSMLSRQRTAELARNSLVQDLLAAARVLQGGGSEVFGESLQQKLETAAQASLARLYPRFADVDADLKAWGAAVEQARTGSDRPFRLLGWERAVEDHPVAREVQGLLVNSKRGTDVRRELKAPPYGWPQDAIDAALIAMHRSGTLRAVLNGQVLGPGQLDQAKIQSAEFRLEKVKLGTEDKLALRGLFQKLQVACKNGEEEQKAREFLAELQRLVEAAAGGPPLPARPNTKWLDDLKAEAGTAQLDAILKQRVQLEAVIAESQGLRKEAEQRLPGWELLVSMLRHADALPIAEEIAPEIAAIREQRSLLSGADPVPSLLARLTAALRAAVTEQRAAFDQAYRDAENALAGDANWERLDDAGRTAILQQRGLLAPIAPSLKTDHDLLAELERQSLRARFDAVGAVPEKVRQVLEDAAKKLEPKARRVALRPATLVSADEVRAWVEEQRQRLLDEVKQGPVIVG
ncbi:MAG: BREX system P-loop protein BrxC [Planctomycetota bacterium]